MAVFDALNFNNEVFRAYITWCSILLLKVLLMAPLTGFQRFRKGVSITVGEFRNNLFMVLITFRLLRTQKIYVLEVKELSRRMMMLKEFAEHI